MSYGLEVQNSSGFIQIDSDYRNYMLKSEGSLTTGAGGTATLTLTSEGYTPLVYIKMPYGTNWVRAHISPTQLYIYVMNASGTPVSGYTVQYRIYSRALSATSDSYGLRIWNASGSVVFDSGRGYPRIKLITNLHPWVGTTAATRNISYSITNAWFQVMPHWIYAYTSGSDYEETYYMVYRHNSAGSVTLGSAAYVYDFWSGTNSYTGILRDSGAGTIPASVGYMGSLIEG